MDAKFYSVTFKALGSLCECRLPANSQHHAESIAAPAITEVLRIEHKYSRYRSDSILSQINAQAGKSAVSIDQETAELLDYADVLFQASDGLFDITSGVLRQIWDFTTPRLPSSVDISKTMQKIGWEHVQRSSKEIFLPQAGMEIDFGGFGKEYAADRAASVLMQEGIANGLIDLGGDLRLLGPQADGQAWQLGIQHPRALDQTIASIPVTSGALATSGDYERYFDLDGTRYCHILNPKTAYPVRHWQSVSIVAPICIAAGSYATIAMLKEAEALPWLEQSGLSYLLIDGEGKQHFNAA